jgi:hypothetical protein
VTAAPSIAPLSTTIRAIVADETIEGPVTITATVTHREDYLSGDILPWAALTLADGDASIHVQVQPREFNQRTIEPHVGALVTVTGQLVTDNVGLIIFASALNRPTIANLLASDQIKGEVQITGRITHVETDTTNAGHDWAVITVTDLGLDTIDVELHPKTYAALTIKPLVGDIVQATGRLCLPPGADQIVIYGQSLTQVEQ